MFARLRPIVLSALICTTLLARAAGAQRSIEVGPLISLYSPVGSYHHDAAYFVVGTPDTPSDNGGRGWGGEARMWLGQRLGLQLQGATSSVDHDTVVTPGGPRASSTSVLSVTAQALYNLLPAPSATRLWLSAGGGFIQHSGSSYAPYGSPTTGIGALGLGAAIPLARGVAVSLGVTSLLYPWSISGGGGPYQSGFQVDLLTHVGVTMGWP